MIHVLILHMHMQPQAIRFIPCFMRLSLVRIFSQASIHTKIGTHLRALEHQIILPGKFALHEPLNAT